MSEPRCFHLVAGNGQQLHVIAGEFFNHLVRAGLEQEEVYSLFGEQTGIAMNEEKNLEHF